MIKEEIAKKLRQASNRLDEVLIDADDDCCLLDYWDNADISYAQELIDDEIDSLEMEQNENKYIVCDLDHNQVCEVDEFSTIDEAVKYAIERRDNIKSGTYKSLKSVTSVIIIKNFYCQLKEYFIEEEKKMTKLQKLLALKNLGYKMKYNYTDGFQIFKDNEVYYTPKQKLFAAKFENEDEALLTIYEKCWDEKYAKEKQINERKN